MIKPELNEIKKQFTPRTCSVSRIAGCYVDGDKNVKMTFAESFHSIPEEETYKYFEILRKSLSGQLGKTALSLDFPSEAEEEGGTQEFLLRLRDSKLKDDALLNEFYERVIESYDYVGNYLILLITDVYDIPGKTTDNILNEDASELIYDYILCTICPVTLSKPGLSYDSDENVFRNRIRDWVVELPDAGFLFPAFNDRMADIHGIMYYIKDSEEQHIELADRIIGVPLSLSAKTQKEAFRRLIEETLGDSNDYEAVSNIHENLTEMETDHKNREIAEPLTLDKQEVRKLFERSGVDDEHMENFDRIYDEEAGEDTSFFAGNIHNTRSYEVKTPDVVIKVNPERSDLVRTEIINGIKCLVIEITDQVEVNGIGVRT